MTSYHCQLIFRLSKHGVEAWTKIIQKNSAHELRIIYCGTVVCFSILSTTCWLCIQFSLVNFPCTEMSTVVSLQHAGSCTCVQPSFNLFLTAIFPSSYYRKSRPNFMKLNRRSSWWQLTKSNTTPRKWRSKRFLACFDLILYSIAVQYLYHIKKQYCCGIFFAPCLYVSCLPTVHWLWCSTGHPIKSTSLFWSTMPNSLSSIDWYSKIMWNLFSNLFNTNTALVASHP